MIVKRCPHCNNFLLDSFSGMEKKLFKLLDNRNELCVSDLAKALNISVIGVHVLCDRLEKAGVLFSDTRLIELNSSNKFVKNGNRRVRFIKIKR